MSLISSQNVGAELKAARKTAGMSQGALSRELANRGLVMDQTAISRVESGERELRYREAILLREIVHFGVEHADLQTFSEAAAFRRIRAAIESVPQVGRRHQGDAANLRAALARITR